MSVTKYVMTTTGLFVLASKYTGFEHTELALIGLGVLEPKDNPEVRGGFVYDNRDGTIQVFGRSESMNADSQPDDAKIIMAALEAGQVRVESLEDLGKFGGDMAGNHPSMTGDPISLQGLRDLKILLS